jgi:hypothetical protein
MCFWIESAIYTAYACYLYKRYVDDTGSDIMDPPFAIFIIYFAVYTSTSTLYFISANKLFNKKVKLCSSLGASIYNIARIFDCILSYWILGYPYEFLCCDRRALITSRWSLLLAGTFIFPILTFIHYFIKRHREKRLAQITLENNVIDDAVHNATKIDIIRY